MCRASSSLRCPARFRPVVLCGDIFHTAHFIDLGQNEIRILKHSRLASRQIRHPQHDSSLTKFLESPVNADFLYRLVSFPDSGGVNESEQDAVDIQRFLYSVTSRAGNIRNDRALLPEQGIEKRTFTRIRSPDNRHRDTVLDSVATAE